jgi:hypothetical protein
VPDELLTPAEVGVLRRLAAVQVEFAALPEHRPGEFGAWVAAMHQLQDLVMSRAAVRAYPDEFTALEERRPDD